jgi:hypothetical protein
LGLKRCPVCSVKVKEGNLRSHMKRVHPDHDAPKRAPTERGSRRPAYALFAVVILVIASLLAYGLLSGLPAPKISVSPLTYQFGTISQNEVSTTAYIENEGDSDLVISGISTSCGCTSAVLTVRGRESPVFGMHDNPQGWSETISPGETATLEVTYDASLHPDVGPVLRIVYIRSNDPSDPEVEIELRATVVP